MKKLPLVVMLLGFTLGVPAAFAQQAQDAHHPDQAQPVAGVAAAPSPEQVAQRMKDNLNRMQAQLDAIGQAKDPAEHTRLLGEHMQAMRENMYMARGMMQGNRMAPGMMGGGMMGGGMPGSGMMGGGMMGGGMMGGGMMDHHMKGGGHMAAAGSGAIEGRIGQIEKRMDMMQMMMEQMARSRMSGRPGK